MLFWLHHADSLKCGVDVLLYFILDLGVVDQCEVQLEIIKVVEGLADVPAPMEHVFVKALLYQ